MVRNNSRVSIRYIRSKGGLSLANSDTPERVDRSRGYKAIVRGFRMTEYNKYGSLNISMKVGDYSVYLEYEGFKSMIEHGLNENTNSDSLHKLLSKIIYDIHRKGTVRVGCSCPDFIYRYKYLASKKNYLNHAYTKEQRYPRITNPNLKGFACKHVIASITNTYKILKVCQPYIEDKLVSYYGIDN